MNTIYLIIGSIGAGKSTLGTALFGGGNLDYVSSDLYKKKFFDTSGDELSAGYRRADLFASYKMQKNCQNGIDFVYELCPTDQGKIDYIIYLINNFNYKAIAFIISTDDVSLTVTRTLNRCRFEGGDPVSEQKTYNRYHETLENMFQIFEIAERAYFIDNSTVIEPIAFLRENTFHVLKHTEWLDKFILNKIHNHQK